MVRLRITGMTCGHCEKSVEKALLEVPGVERVHSVNRAEHGAVVEGDADPQALVEAVRKAGYEANAIEA